MPATEEKSKIIKEHATSKDDVGSAPVQIALLTARITELTVHLKRHPKDIHSERGLELLVGKRRRLLDYLARTDEPAYQELLKKLKLRK
ncbi:MAG TPA: 30S ribosomal protein S15 [Patescibacteria group bacterium]|jgi:small subunit ribosomal protein S15